MIKNDLGQRIHDSLVGLGIETPHTGIRADKELILASFTDIMGDGLGLNLEDDSLRDTPRRVAKMYCDEVFYGLDYEKFPACTTFANKMRYDEMITSKCTVMSMCEHHFVPFVGHAHIGYIPENKVLGLSKFNRVVDFFSRRPQVQERLTAQIYTALALILETEDVAVVIQAEHFCSKLRGVKDALASTTTSKLGGRFMNNPALRSEFLTFARK